MARSSQAEESCNIWARGGCNGIGAIHRQSAGKDDIDGRHDNCDALSQGTMTGGAGTNGTGGSAGGGFIAQFEREIAKLRQGNVVWNFVTAGHHVGNQAKMHGDRKLRCNFCGHLFQGNAGKAARHFTQSKYCKAARMRVLAEICNDTNYTFKPATARRVQRWMADKGVRDTRAVAGGQQQRMDEGESGERDDVQDALDDEEGLEGGVGEGGKADEAVGDPDLPGEEVVMTSIGWIYAKGLAINAFRGPEFQRVRRAAERVPRTVQFRFPSYRVTAGTEIPLQRGKVASMVSEVRSAFWHTGATILSDGRKSRSGKPLVNFLAGGTNGALLYATVARDGSVRDTADIVYHRWRAIILSFPAKDVIGFCTDSTSNYTAAARRFATDLDADIKRITWLPCSTHVCNLMLLDVGTRVAWVKETIVRDRALWAQHERINTARRHKLGFAKLAQLVEITTNFKLVGCAHQGSGYVLPWVMGTGLEETAGGQEDDEGDVDPEVWGARPDGCFSEHDIERQVVAFHACRPSRADPIQDVFGKRAVELRPWPEPMSDADADSDTSDDEWTDDDDAPVSGDATAERIYFTYGGRPDGMTPHTSVYGGAAPTEGVGDRGGGGGDGGDVGFGGEVDAGGARQGLPTGVKGDGVPTGVEGEGGGKDEEGDGGGEDDHEDEEGPDHGDDHGDDGGDGGDHSDGGDNGHDGNYDGDHGDDSDGHSDDDDHDGDHDDEGRLALVLRDPSVPTLPLIRPEAFAQAGFDVEDLARPGSHDPFPHTGRRSDERRPPGGAYSPPPHIVDSPRWSGSSISGIRGRESGPVDGGSGRRSDGGGSAGSMPPPPAWSTEGGADATTARVPIAGSPPPVAGGVAGGWAAYRRVSDRMRADYDVGRGAFVGRLSPRFQVAASSEGGSGCPSVHMAGRMLGLSR
ncbi:hypothetical protein CBR_g51247 [Chara braunii]|uniref:DUF659 domain-containing protein n=1 Tax=Chara braunii TaxID=69332 RepID=A0A388M864_CHABU|nr:hypothetical protein CBR_g51247 [Chara braunii]|eukprot:GBG90740.1 hypothetical protein CBR_g51247 [Chara braunii]